jgi:hypothetical protein
METLGSGIFGTLILGTPGLGMLGKGMLGLLILGTPGFGSFGAGSLNMLNLGLPGLRLGNGTFEERLFAGCSCATVSAFAANIGTCSAFVFSGAETFSSG